MIKTRRFSTIFSLLLAGVLATGCHDDEKTEPVLPPEPAASAWSKDYMDLSVKPGEDFFRYTLGGWIDNNPNTSQNAIANNELKRISEEVLNAYIAGKGRLGATVSTEYKIMTDEQARSAGVADIRGKIRTLLAAQSREELVESATVLGQTGYLVLWNTRINVSDNKIGENLNGIDATTPGMDYADPALTDAYLGHVQRVLGMLGAATPEEARRIAANALEAERQMTQTWEDGQGGKYFDSYWYTLTSYDKENTYFLYEICTGLIRLFNQGDFGMLRDYLAWSLVRLNWDFLSCEVLEATNDFRRELGQQTRSMDELAREQLCEFHERDLNRDIIDRLTRPGLMEAYTGMAKTMVAVMRDRIERAGWITDASTREEALRKIDRIEIFLMGKRIETRGTPYWESALAYTVQARRALREEKMAARGTYISGEKIVNLMLNDFDYNASLIFDYLVINTFVGTVVDAVLPRLDDPAFFYGYLGTVLGHYLVYHFDIDGQRYDSNGEQRNWWAPADEASYNERARKVSDYYSTLSYKGYQVNGEQVLIQCIGSLGGMSLAYEAMKRATDNAELRDAEGFTAAQRFFFGYTWYFTRGNSEKFAANYQNSTDLYPPLRVMSTCANTDGWYEAFPEVQPGDKWYIAPEKRVGVW